MSKPQVLIFDDDETRRDAWRKGIEETDWFSSSGFTLSAPRTEDFRAAVEELEDRRDKARRHGGEPEEPVDYDLDGTLFDTASIALIDYDLFHLYEDKKHETGEYVAYLVRCYSACGLIVCVNQFGDNTFDLKLEGHPESFADLNLGSEQMTNPGLWVQPQPWEEEEGEEPFRPWYWPLLPLSVEAFERRVQTILSEEGTCLDEPVLQFLGFRRDMIEMMPRATLAFLDVGGDVDPEEITFRQFVDKSGKGRDRKDRVSDESRARIAAARIAKWLERMVLAGQEILVDAPHLAARFPSLVEGEPMSRSLFNHTVDFEGPNLALKKLDSWRFSPDWLSRPAWFGDPIREKIWDSGDGGVETELPELVFCEDRSAFRPTERARPFRITWPTSYSVRYVSEPQEIGVQYRPAVNFVR